MNIKKLFALATMITALSINSSVYGIFEMGADAGYGSYKTTTDWKYVPGNTYSGYMLGGFMHMTFGIPLIVSAGFGPYGNYGVLSNGNDTSKVIRAGGEAFVMLKMVPIISPYLKGGWGYEGSTLTANIPLVNKSFELPFIGTSSQVTLGADYQILLILHAYLEASYINGKGKVLDPNLVPGLSAALPGTVTMPATINSTFSGWKISAGAKLWI